MLGHPKRYKYSLSKDLVFKDNQQERFDINHVSNNFKWFVSGFVDGEGSFCLNVKNRNTVKYGFRIEPAFYVYQHENNIQMLKMINEMFGTGSIHRKTNPSSVFTYQISGISPCFQYVLPFFSTYKLVGKEKVFELFKEAVIFMYNKEHLNKEVP